LDHSLQPNTDWPTQRPRYHTYQGDRPPWFNENGDDEDPNKENFNPNIDLHVDEADLVEDGDDDLAFQDSRPPQPPLDQQPGRQEYDDDVEAELLTDNNVGNFDRLLHPPHLHHHNHHHQPVPLTYRGVRSLKHKHDKSFHGIPLRKSNSMHDLSSDPVGRNDMDFHLAFTRPRSRSKESLFETFPRRRLPVSLSFDAAGFVAGSNNMNNMTDQRLYSHYLQDEFDPPPRRPKYLLEYLLTPQPEKPKPKNSRYLRLAGIPTNRPIENYIGHAPEVCSTSRGQRSNTLPSGALGVNTANLISHWDSISDNNTSTLPRRRHTTAIDTSNVYSIMPQNLHAHHGTPMYGGRELDLHVHDVHYSSAVVPPPLRLTGSAQLDVHSIQQEVTLSSRRGLSSASAWRATNDAMLEREARKSSLTSTTAAAPRAPRTDGTSSSPAREILRSQSPTTSYLLSRRDKNETDELKVNNIIIPYYL
jgi:hypothetical protein